MYAEPKQVIDLTKEMITADIWSVGCIFAELMAKQVEALLSPPPSAVARARALCLSLSLSLCLSLSLSLSRSFSLICLPLPLLLALISLCLYFNL